MWGKGDALLSIAVRAVRLVIGDDMPVKRLARIGLSVLLAAAVGVTLWFASPQPARALTINFPSLPAAGTLGQTYGFSVQD